MTNLYAYVYAVERKLANHSGGLRTGTPISEHDFSCNFSHHISRTLHVVNKEVAP